MSVATKQKLLGQDIGLILVLAVLAACGLIYEYLLSHYAGRVLGAMETVIFAMIGVMIVSMGIGAFLSRIIPCPFSGFAWLEVSVALIGATSVLLIAACISFAQLFPDMLVEVFALPYDVWPGGGTVATLLEIAQITPFIAGFSLGLLLGMEIPLIARVRETLHQETLSHNTGTLYGADYIGAGIGAGLWVSFMLTMEVALASALTASVNLLAGLFFLWRYFNRIQKPMLLLIAHGLLAVLTLIIVSWGGDWLAKMEDLLYQDQVIHRQDTPFQHMTLTSRRIGSGRPPIISLYLNGRLQFASNDEQIYHQMLIYPAMAAAARTEKILVIGGGDGLALRDILLWQPHTVTLIDQDRDLVALFTPPLPGSATESLQNILSDLNQKALADPRLELLFGDAYLQTDQLIAQNRAFDVIIVDLPDPSHPDLNKLYTARFYSKLRLLLSGDGVLAVQSTSPFHAKKAFLSIGKTVKYSGFKQVQQYHQNVPSFGEWGWTIATLSGKSALQRIAALKQLPLESNWLTRGLLLAAFEFPAGFFEDLPDIEVNRLGSQAVYRYHHQAWSLDEGVFLPIVKVPISK